MTLSLVNTGSVPNDATGDPLQTAFTKVNAAITAINSGPSNVYPTALVSANAVAPIAGGSLACGILVSSTANLGFFFGVGAPTFLAAEGSLYSNVTGTPGACLYVNTSSGSGTTWTAATSP
jgi:hypothetical protein